MENRKNFIKDCFTHVVTSIARQFYKEMAKCNNIIETQGTSFMEIPKINDTTVPTIKKQNAITLIALVITIIILLILSGVVINLTLGEHGIIKIAQNAGKEYQNAAEDEQKKLGWLLNETDNIINGTGGTVIPDAPTLVSQITPNDYGKTINYSANGVNDWKVFYNDGKNVYIIASDYLDMSVTPIDLTTTKMIKGNGKYTVYWDSSIGTNIEAVGTLNNTSNWSAFASGKGGESATGGPTYKMLADSWNSNPKTNSITLDPTNYKEGLTDSTGLYIPHTSDVDGCSGYWLASTNASYADHAFAMLYGGAVYYNPFTSDLNGIRPVVCLKAGTLGLVKDTVSITDVVTVPKSNPTLASQITANDYGKTINYSANGVSNWRIFYNDGTNVYIIASNYLDMSVTPTPIDITTIQMTRGQGKYALYWQNASTNIEAVETLTNTSNWSAFANGKGGESATGGPTYEMLADSWSTNPKTNSITLDPTNGQDGLTDSTGLYIPHTSSVDSCQGYWLASTNDNYTDHAFAMLYVRAVYYNPLTSNWNGVRPVVCLNKDITGTVGYTVTMD